MSTNSIGTIFNLQLNPALKGAAHIGEAGCICRANNENSQICYVHCASPVSGMKIAAPIVLAQHQEHGRIGEGQELLCCTDWKRKFVQYKAQTYYMTKKKGQRHGPRPIANNWYLLFLTHLSVCCTLP